MLAKTITVVTLIAAIIFMILVQSSNPTSAGPGGILAVFFLLYVILVGVFTWLTRAINWLFVHVFNQFFTRKPANEISTSHAYYISSVTAMGPIMLLGIGSVGRIGFYEVFLVVIFEIIAVFYIQKRLR